MFRLALACPCSSPARDEVGVFPVITAVYLAGPSPSRTGRRKLMISGFGDTGRPILRTEK